MIPYFPPSEIAALKESLNKATKIVITTHHKPDGDALGSSLALYNYFLSKGADASVVSPSEFPDFLSWMRGSEQVVDFIRNTKTATSLVAGASHLFCLDFNEPGRTERMKKILDESPAEKILIDHHLDPVDFCRYTFSFPTSCATSELIYHFIRTMGDEALIDRDIAECLYAGIMTDTGSFRFDSMSPDTHEVVASLLRSGARQSLIHDYIYDNNSESRMHFLGHCLKEKLFVVPGYDAAYIAVSKKEMDEYNHQPGDLEGIVNFALSIKGMKMAVLFSERDGIVKMSFRSKNDFSVKELAEKYFEGGGHRNAAGGRSTLSLDDTVKKFLEIITHYHDQLASRL